MESGCRSSTAPRTSCRFSHALATRLGTVIETRDIWDAHEVAPGRNPIQQAFFTHIAAPQLPI
jgi:hypothetical protein